MTTDEDRNQIGQLIRRYCQVPSPNEEFVQSLAARARQELTRALQEPSKAEHAACSTWIGNRPAFEDERPLRWPAVAARDSHWCVVVDRAGVAPLGASGRCSAGEALGPRRCDPAGEHEKDDREGRNVVLDAEHRSSRAVW